MRLRKLHIDFETRSEVNLKACGVGRYAAGESTEVMCLAYKVDKLPTQIIKLDDDWNISNIRRKHPRLIGAIEDGSFSVRAHNAFFEQSIYRDILVKRFGWPEVPLKRWACTAAKAAVHALPRKLETVSKILGLNHQKDMVGHKVMQKMSKPRSQWLSKGKGDKYFTRPDQLESLYAYCITDVDCEAELDDFLEDLSPHENEVWMLDQRINHYGFKVDRDLIRNALKIIDREREQYSELVSDVTNREVTSVDQRERILQWVRDQGVSLDNMQADTLREKLKEKLPHDVRTILEARLSLGKASVAKYLAFNNYATPDDIIRGTLVYHQATTGRWAGKGPQPHNLPSRGLFKKQDPIIKAVKEGDLEWLQAVYGGGINSLVSCARGVIQAREGCELLVGDWAAIEARVLAWLTGNKPALTDYHNGVDRYKRQASLIFSVPIEEIEKGFKRDVGKQAELGCGYGMGVEKFLATCLKAGINLSPELATKAVKLYRKNNKAVVDFWGDINMAAIRAVQRKGTTVKCGLISWKFEGRFLWCVLPSGRKLAYYDPRVSMAATPWGEMRPTLSYMTEDSKTHKWVRRRSYGGLLTENIVQAIARDIMAAAMLRLDDAGFKLLLTVHDEIVAEVRRIGLLGLQKFEHVMAATPKWAVGCPIAVEAWADVRYHK